MTTIRACLALAVTGIGLSFGAPAAQADTFEHIDSLAMRLQGQTRELVSEVRAHYRHASGYSHLLADARQMNRLAGHIHEVVHDGSVSHLSHDLEELDQLFHHFEHLISDIEHDADYHWGHGHIDGDTRHVRRLLRSMEDTLHHLQEDVHELSHVHVAPAPVVVREPVYVQPRNRGGIRYNNGNNGIRIGF